jgi:hypothetical protein
VTQKIEFTTRAGRIAVHDAALVLDGEDPQTVLFEAIWQAINLDVLVTIGDIEMPATMWENPDHWSEDWAERLGIPATETESAVYELIASALTEYKPPGVELDSRP